MASNRTRARRIRQRCAMAATVTLPVCLLAQVQDARSADANSSSTASSPDTRCPEQAQVDSGRRSPSVPVLPWEPTPCEPARLPALPSAALADFAAIPDRWRVVSMLGAGFHMPDEVSP